MDININDIISNVEREVNLLETKKAIKIFILKDIFILLFFNIGIISSIILFGLYNTKSINYIILQTFAIIVLILLDISMLSEIFCLRYLLKLIKINEIHKDSGGDDNEL